MTEAHSSPIDADAPKPSAAEIRTLRNVSLMPAGLGDALKPEQVASIIAFLRSAP
jgi:hypothetical protein